MAQKKKGGGSAIKIYLFVQKLHHKPHRDLSAVRTANIPCIFSLLCSRSGLQTGNDLGSISILVLTSWVYIQDMLANVPHRRKGLQTSSCPSISAKYRMKSPEDLKWDKLQGPGSGPTSISYLCWWPGVEGKLSIEYCIQLSGSSGRPVSCVDIRSSASLCAPSPLLPSCFWHYSDPGLSAVCCGSHLHTCHEKTAVVQHNIISAAEREGKACLAVPPSVYSPKEFNCGASVQWTNIFYDKDVQKLPPFEFLTARTCNTITRKAMGEPGCWKKILYPGMNMSLGVFTAHSCTQDGVNGNLCAFIKKTAPRPWREFFEG